MDRDSVVGIATRDGMDGLGSETQLGRDIPHLSRSTLCGPSYVLDTDLFLRVKRPGSGVNHPPHLAPRLKKE